ncbi:MULTISPECIES: TetR/AcrR family transcriptional regulator [Arthrobacter]|uniref:DNA-binding transcriptional regulator, AcrR family n=1 Tax=Arthrobacter woluwensis TaxID=156980 RepID=A0A1H4RZN8_9MICC|nr:MULTISPECIES: TetR/AcrR family transcriptional regulator [Arthrobacter]SEC37395.1 DNA-binding transcriptional regulator, AcrR family [Arthrobacter woluwensis]
MADTTTPGRRERKKAATRKAISDAALELFQDRGFDAVTIKEVAERADVSLATVYAHFPQKEALVYDEDDEIRDALLDAVRNREPGMTICTAIHQWLRAVMEEHEQYGAQVAAFDAMVQAAPSLREYERSMWMRHEKALILTIADELGLPATDPFIQVFSHYALETWAFLDRTEDPRASLEATFALLSPGWTAFEERVTSGS